MTPFWALTANFRHVPLEVRGQLTHKECKFLAGIAPDAAEHLFVFTCNRVELYACGGDPQAARTRWMDFAKLPEAQAEDGVFHLLNDRDALEHLFRVVASMDSMVVGETQVIGQVKRAYELATQQGTVGTLLHKIFQKAFKVSKAVRSTTDIGRLQVSIPSLGVSLAEKVFGDLSSKTVGVVGCGEIGRVSAEHFSSIEPKRVLLYNRTTETAQILAAQLRSEYQTQVEVLATPESVARQADILVSAVSDCWLRHSVLEQLDARGRPQLILDLSVPRSVEVGQWTSLYVYCVDDLQGIAAENNSIRQLEMTRAQRIIESDAELLWQEINSHSRVGVTLSRLSSKLEQTTDQELQFLRARLPGISEAEWKEIETMAHRLRFKFVQDPMVEFKTQMQQSAEPESLLTLFKNLFRL